MCVLCSECKFFLRTSHGRLKAISYYCSNKKISKPKCHPVYGKIQDYVACIDANPACDCPYYVPKETFWEKIKNAVRK